jgi:hypothetical protein
MCINILPHGRAYVKDELLHRPKIFVQLVDLVQFVP